MMNSIFTLTNFKLLRSNILGRKYLFTYLFLNKSFHYSSLLNRKMYFEYENRHAYNIMEKKGYVFNLDDFCKSTEKNVHKNEVDSILTKNHLKSSPDEVIHAFESISSYCSKENICISNKMFDNFIDWVTDNIKYMSDDQLKQVFICLSNIPETESVRTRNYVEVWVAVDDECTKRIQNWSIDQQLSFVTLTYMLNITKLSDFSFKCLQRLTRNAKLLTPSQLVKIYFFISVMRSAPKDMFNLELQLFDNISNFSIEELGIMSLGFFKSKTPIRSMELVTTIAEKIIAECDTIDEVSLAALLKVIRYSMKIVSSDVIYRLLEKLSLEVDRLSIMCCVHIALLGTSTLTFHKKCLDNVGQSILKRFSEARLKDLERLALTYGTFKYYPETKECFMEKLLMELRKPERDSEINRYGRTFACCINYLSWLELYPLDLIERCLSSQYLELVYGKSFFTYGREVLALHNISEIFSPKKGISMLSSKMVELLSKKYTDYVPDRSYKRQFNVAEKMFLDIVDTLKILRGEEYLIRTHILTHHQRGDIVICNDQNNYPLIITDVFPNNVFGPIIKPPDKNKWIVLIIAGRNTEIQNSDAVSGLMISKVIELKAIGYYPLLVKWKIWQNLQSTEDKCHYLENLIKTTH